MCIKCEEDRKKTPDQRHTEAAKRVDKAWEELKALIGENQLKIVDTYILANTLLIHAIQFEANNSGLPEQVAEILLKREARDIVLKGLEIFGKRDQDASAVAPTQGLAHA